MTNAESIQAIKVEIERRLKDYWKICFHDVKAYNEDSNVRELKELLSFLDSPESEKPMNLEEEINLWISENENIHHGDKLMVGLLKDVARHFAQWGAEHRDCSEIPNNLEEAAEKHLDTVFGKGKHRPFYKVLFIAGGIWQRQQMLKEAVEGKIAERAQGKLYARCQVPKTMGVEFGDKVRVIVLPKEDRYEQFS